MTISPHSGTKSTELAKKGRSSLMSAINGVLLAIGSSSTASIVAKVTVTTSFGLGAAWLANGSRAAVRHSLLAATFGVMLLLPIVSVVVPPLPIGVPVRVESRAALLPLVMDVGTDPSVPTVGAGSRVTPAASQVSKLSLTNLLLTGWAAGVAVFLLPMMAGLWEIRSLRRSALPWRRGQSVLNALTIDAGVYRNVKVLLHESPPGPMTCGLLRPALILPQEAENWNKEDLNRAIVHELEHVRRGDSLTRCLARAMCAVYWFHPLVWIAWRKLVLEAERSCDDAVLRQSDATAYANQLVDLAMRLSATRRSPALAMANRADLAARVRALLDARQRRGRAGILPLALTCTVAAVLVIAMSPLTLVAAPQAAPGSAPRFEVASIKPTGGRGGGRMRPFPGRLTATAPLRVLMQAAYHVQPFQIVGGPDWMGSDQYEIDARAAGDPGNAQLFLMLQSLLADRFQLQFHRESREMPIYALAPYRGGIKLPPPRDGNCVEDTDVLGSLANPGARMQPAGPASALAPRCGGLDVMLEAEGARMRGGKVPMAEFVRVLSRVLGRTVTDQTGFSGVFDINLSFLPDDTTAGLPPPPPGAIPADTASPSIFNAVQQLGLRLESTKGSVEILVIDHAEKPSEN